QSGSSGKKSLSPSGVSIREILGITGPDDKYTLHEEIGSGGMGTVSLAVDNEIHREVAIKLMSGAEESGRRVRFIEEAQITGQLEHPNIVPIHELGLDKQGRIFFSMKLVKGKSLREFLDEFRKGPPPPFSRYPLQKLLTIFVNICNAVSFAHSRGVIHRDLKPGNVMIGDFGEVRVMDWGLAKVLDKKLPGKRARPQPEEHGDHVRIPETRDPQDTTVTTERFGDPKLATMEGTIWGTLTYMPPEQASGKTDEVDERSDIFCLGAILFEILSLNAPIQGKNIRELLRNAGACKLAPIDSCIPPHWHVPKELTAITLKALSKDKASRYQSIDDLRDDIERYQGGRAVSAKEDTAWETIQKLIYRNKAVSMAVGVALTVIFFFTGIFSYVNLRERKRAETALRNYTREQKAKMELIRRDLEERERRWICVFEDDFSNSNIRDRWDIIYGKYLVRNGVRNFVETEPDCSVINGELRICGGTPQALLLNDSISGDLAIEFDCRQESDYLNDISCFIDALRSARPKALPFSGYIFQYGGHDNTCNKLTRSGSILWQEFKTPLEKGKRYHVRAERVGTLFSLTVNDTMIFEVEDPKRLYGTGRNAVGLMSWGAEVWYDNIRIFRKGASLKEDALDLAGRHLQRGNYITARDLFLDVYNASLNPARKIAASRGRDKAAFLIDVQKNLSEYRRKIKRQWPENAFKLEIVESGLSLEITSDAGATSIRSLSPLEGIPLSRLNIAGALQVTDLKPLGSLELSWLDMHNCTAVKDLAPLTGMPLVYLNINQCKAIHDIRPLHSANLHSFFAYGTSIHDLSPLHGMPIREMDIRNCTNLADISALKGMPLEILRIDNTNIVHLDALGDAPLKRLTAKGCPIVSIEPVAVPSLVHLDVRSTSVKDFTPLHNVDLYEFQAANTSFGDLNIIRHMTVVNLNVRYTQIKSLEPLAEKKLKDVFISYNTITDLSPLRTM
ncbi:MAG: protein kinase, partial [Chitinivibrionales bacterium]|nr:protein kinase [Chitinivibrionales bacterium]